MLLRRTLCCAALIASASTAAAQVAGELKGRVTDPTGAAVAHAHVTATEMRTGEHYATATGPDGYFDFAGLVSGRYQLDARAPGFGPLLRQDLTLAVGQTLAVSLPLAVGNESQQVTVTEDAPILQTQTSDIQFTVPPHGIEAIPLNARNFIQLTTLAPGVELPPGTLLPRINGGRPRTNEYLYDGISALQPEPGQVAFFPILDLVQEFTVESNNVSAEFGRFNGGVVNLATRSGTDQLHGSLFEYLRNEDLNARNYFAPAASTGQAPRKPEYRRNLYGGTLGLPLLLQSSPARLFFFGDYQGIRQAIGVTRIATVPTLQERAGNFAGVSTTYDPATTHVVNGRILRNPFPNNTITTPLDPAAVSLLARIPLPNLPNSSPSPANNYTRTANDADHQNQFDLRLDAASGSRDHAFARYTYYNEVETPVTPFPDGSGATSGSVLGTGNVAGPSNILGQQAVLSETHTFTPHLLTQGRLGYTRRANDQTGAALPTTASAALGIPGIPSNAAFSNALPLFTFTGFGQLGSSASVFSQYQTGVYELVDELLFTRGRHDLRVGADLRWYQLNAVAPANPTGSFAFTSTGTDSQGTGATAGATGGNSFASFLLGQVDTFSIDLQTSILRPRDHLGEYFVQDDWRVTPRLTANFGLRWTLNNPSTEKNNQGAVFNLSTQLLDYAGLNGNPKSARETHYRNLGPRLGFAYALSPRTVVRSGFGIVFFDQSGITTPFTLPQFPFIQNVRQATQDAINSPFTLSAGPTVSPIALTPAAGLGQSVYTANRAAGSGYVQQWNLAVQRSLTNSLSFEVAYVGSHGVHVGVPDANLNQLSAAQLALGLTDPAALTAQVPNPFLGQIPASSTLGGKTVAAAQLLKPYPRFQNLATYRQNTGATNYNAVEAKLEERLRRGLALTFAYTHSRLIDDASSVFSSTVLSSPNASSLIAADTFRPDLERDVSTGDLPNVLAASVVYELPTLGNHRFPGRTGTMGSDHRSLRQSGSLGWTHLLGGNSALGNSAFGNALLGNSALGNFGNTLLGGWSLNSLITAQSGMPVTVTQGTNFNAFAGFALQRPNLVAPPNLPPNGGPQGARGPARFFNTAAFAAAPQFTVGNASRNPVRGPAFRNWDASLIKRTPLAEHTQLEFRAELFNTLNTPAFAQPNGTFGTPAFGTITATAAEQRVAQFALRLTR